MAVDKGQREAAESIGLKPSKVMNLVILPQASEELLFHLLQVNILNLTKELFISNCHRLYGSCCNLGGISLNQTGREMETMVIVMLNLFISFFKYISFYELV